MAVQIDHENQSFTLTIKGAFRKGLFCEKFLFLIASHTIAVKRARIDCVLLFAYLTHCCA